MNHKLEAIRQAQDAMRDLNNALFVDVTFDNAREIIGRKLGQLYKAAEQLEMTYGFTDLEIFGELIAEIQTQEKAG